MRKVLMSLIVALMAAGSLAGQSAPEKDGYGDLRTALRNLVTAEERFYADHGTYTSDLAALGMPMPRSGAEAQNWRMGVVVVQAGGRSWWGQAWIYKAAQRGCVVSIGDTKYFTTIPATTGGTAIKPDADDGHIVCDPT